MKDWIMEHKNYLFAAVLLLIGGIYYFTNNSNKEDQLLSATSTAETELGSANQESGKEKQKDELEQPESIMVDVKGQIHKPGVYQAHNGERVIDVINRAGGVTEKADKTQVNFAEHIQDEMVIYIPAKGEEGLMTPVPSGGSGVTANGSASQAKINLNQADATELQNLPGIGPAKAAAIIEYRETSGAFQTVEDLKNVSGIGDKTFEKLKDLVDIR